MSVYLPQEDSYFLSEILEKYIKKIKDKEIKILDMGAGSGIQAEVCRKAGLRNILTADINEEAVKLLKNKGFKSVKSDLFSNIKNKKFDLVVFNPPYLPEDKYDKSLDTSGGKKGYELIIKFLKNAKFFLNKNGKILLLFSSLSNPKTIKEKAKDLGYYIKFLGKKNLFFEKIYVYEFGYR